MFIYALLPTMNGANAELLNKAIDEMVEYYKDDNERLTRELRWMGIVLRRADTVALDEKRIVEERLNMYDDLMERDPKMRMLFAEKEAEGEIKGLQEGFIDIVETRFPDLAEIAEERVTQVTESTMLRLLLKAVAAAADETAAKKVLDILLVA